MPKQVQIMIVEQAIAKIKQGWTKSRLARDKDSEGIAPNSPDACCWCSIGALCSVVDAKNECYWPLGDDIWIVVITLGTKAKEKLLQMGQNVNFLQNLSSTQYIVEYNDADSTTQEAVVSLFEEVLAEIKGRPEQASLV